MADDPAPSLPAVITQAQFLELMESVKKLQEGQKKTIHDYVPDTQSVLAFVAAFGFILLTLYLAISGKTDTDAFKIMIGALISVALTQVYQYYFGSSKQSQAKDDTIKQQVQMAAEPQKLLPPPQQQPMPMDIDVTAAAKAAAPAAAERAAPAAARRAAPPAADVAAPPAARAAVEEVLAERDEGHKP